MTWSHFHQRTHFTFWWNGSYQSITLGQILWLDHISKCTTGSLVCKAFPLSPHLAVPRGRYPILQPSLSPFDLFILTYFLTQIILTTMRFCSHFLVFVYILSILYPSLFRSRFYFRTWLYLRISGKILLLFQSLMCFHFQHRPQVAAIDCQIWIVNTPSLIKRFADLLEISWKHWTFWKGKS